MDKDKAQEALAQLDYNIAATRDKINGLEQDKQKIRTDISGISSSKKDKMERLQSDINGTRIPLLKKRKRDARDREKKSFDVRIDSRKKQIEAIDTRIAEERKKISGWEKIKKAIKLDQTNGKK